MAPLMRFDEVMERHSHRVYTLARYALGSQQDAEDVAQEVFTRLWESWATIDLERVEGWLIRVTSHTCIDVRRRRSTRQKAIELLGRSVDDGAGTESDPSAAVESAELRACVVAAISRLPEPFRAIVILREIEGLSYNAIAEALELPMASVKVTLYRARARLGELLEAQNPASPPREVNARVV